MRPSDISLFGSFNREFLDQFYHHCCSAGADYRCILMHGGTNTWHNGRYRRLKLSRDDDVNRGQCDNHGHSCLYLFGCRHDDWSQLSDNSCSNGADNSNCAEHNRIFQQLLRQLGRMEQQRPWRLDLSGDHLCPEFGYSDLDDDT